MILRTGLSYVTILHIMNETTLSNKAEKLFNITNEAMLSNMIDMLRNTYYFIW